MVGIQHEVFRGTSVDVSYNRRAGRNFRVTRSLAVDPSADFSPFCVTAPSDARLPGGGGYQVCGLYDNTVIHQNNTYGRAWLNAIQVLPGRIAKVGVTVTF
jgi:hypothetical protein